MLLEILKFVLYFISAVYVSFWLLTFWAFHMSKVEDTWYRAFLETAKWPWRFYQMHKKIGMFKEKNDD